jgi:hypothetical protein
METFAHVRRRPGVGGLKSRQIRPSFRCFCCAKTPEESRWSPIGNASRANKIRDLQRFNFHILDRGGDSHAEIGVVTNGKISLAKQSGCICFEAAMG